MVALVRENKEVLWSSLVKETMKRKKPSFSESYHGYRTFSDLLEDAEREGIIQLRTDSRSRTYVITGFGKEEGKDKKEALKEQKERKPQKKRIIQKPHWRPRTKGQKPQPPALPVATEEPIAPLETGTSSINIMETDPET
jgi:hypothetical protein